MQEAPNVHEEHREQAETNSVEETAHRFQKGRRGKLSRDLAANVLRQGETGEPEAL